MSYIIKNCPCFLQDKKCNIWVNSDELCSKNPNCIIKQIIQICIEYSDKWEDCDFSNGLASEILKLLDIQEIEQNGY